MLDEQQGRAEQRRKKEAALAALFAGPGSKHARAPAGTNGGGNAGTQCSGPGQAVVAAGQGEEEAAVPVQDTAIPAGGGFSFNFAL